MDAFIRAAQAGKFRAVRFDGFWAPMDTLKERAALEDMHRSGNRPWALWEKSGQRSRGARRCGPCRYQQIRLMLRDYSDAMNFSVLATN